MVVLARVEMGVVEVALLACPDDRAAEGSGKTSLEINPSTLKGEISDNKLRASHFYDDTITNLIVVF
jgi:hypothetical protein